MASAAPHRVINIVKGSDEWNINHLDVSVLINNQGFVSMYIYDELYVSQQSASSKEMLEFYGVPKKVIKKMKSRGVIGGAQMFDISENPGQRILIGHTYLVAAWKMWFGQNFYKIVSKERLLSFPFAYRVEELPTGHVFVQLFENIEDSSSIDAQKVEIAWKDWLDFDYLEKTYP